MADIKAREQFESIEADKLKGALKQEFEEIAKATSNFTNKELSDLNAENMDILLDLIQKQQPEAIKAKSTNSEATIKQQETKTKAKPTANKQTTPATEANPTAKKQDEIASEQTLGKKSKSVAAEIRFIKRYINLNGKMQNFESINAFTKMLQRDISKKLITKKSKFAPEIQLIQNKLVEINNFLIDNDLDSIEIKINDKDLAKLKAILKEQKAKPEKKSQQLSGAAPTELTKAEITELPTGFTRADEEISINNTFTLPGQMGKFLGDLQRFKLAMAIKGDRHAGKSEFVKQLADSFIEMGFTVGFFDLEQGGLVSKDTKASIDRNVKPENRSKLAVTGEAENGLPTVKDQAKNFDVIIVDSWQKLNAPNQRFDELRREFPNTIWVIIFQQNAEGGTRGGVAVDFDAPVALKVNRVDKSFDNNFVEIEKNRGNDINKFFMIKDKKVLMPDELEERLKSEKEEKEIK